MFYCTQILARVLYGHVVNEKSRFYCSGFCWCHVWSTWWQTEGNYQQCRSDSGRHLPEGLFLQWCLASSPFHLYLADKSVVSTVNCWTCLPLLAAGGNCINIFFMHEKFRYSSTHAQVVKVWLFISDCAVLFQFICFIEICTHLIENKNKFVALLVRFKDLSSSLGALRRFSFLYGFQAKLLTSLNLPSVARSF